MNPIRNANTQEEWLGNVSAVGYPSACIEITGSCSREAWWDLFL